MQVQQKVPFSTGAKWAGALNIPDAVITSAPLYAAHDSVLMSVDQGAAITHGVIAAVSGVFAANDLLCGDADRFLFKSGLALTEGLKTAGYSVAMAGGSSILASGLVLSGSVLQVLGLGAAAQED